MKHPAAGACWLPEGRPSRRGSSSASAGASRSRPGRRPRGLLIAACSILLVLVVCCVIAIGRGLERRKLRGRLSGEAEPLGLIPGEFERQEGILLAWPREARPPFPEDVLDLYRRVDRLFCDIVQALWRSVRVIVLVEDSQSRDRVVRLLRQAKVPPDAVRFVQAPFTGEWIRDYGPVTVRAGDGSWTLVDAEYLPKDIVSLDPHDDRLASVLGALFQIPTVRAPIAIQHGNLQSNGRGLCIATRRLLDHNAARGYDADDVTRILKRFYGAGEVVFLESLRGEPTGHVDMFATFPSPDTVVVGQCSPGSDPANAAILDRNAARLASVGPPCGPLKVVRVPMPPTLRSGDGPARWPTYTNVVYANGTLLVPVYPDLDPAGGAFALSLYRQLLPDWAVVGIDVGPLVNLFGGAHCVTMNLPSLGKLLGDAAAERPLRVPSSTE